MIIIMCIIINVSCTIVINVYINLIQQLGTDVYGYETMLVYQVNKYQAADGTKPFGKAPDSQLTICSLKMVN